MSSAKDRHLEQLRARFAEVGPRRAFELASGDAVLVDVREESEWAEGSPAGAVRLSRSFLELRIAEVAPDPDRPVLLLCGSGVRSLLAAPGLEALGYTDVRSVAGGFRAWREEGLPTESPSSGRLDERARQRYARHLRIPEVGERGQEALLAASVLVVGAGGLGSPAAFYLAAAGIGRLGLVDHDVVDRSNLQRQILHRDSRIGHPKVESARETLHGLNPDIDLRVHPTRLDADNVDALVADHDLVVDGSDNFATRYLLNDACVRLGKAVVHGAVHRFEGQVSVFWPGRPGDPGPCYRCLFPEPPPPELAPNCAEAGVLGVLPGVVGTLQAVEAIKLVLGLGDPLVGRLLLVDALGTRFEELRQVRRADCPACGTPD